MRKGVREMITVPLPMDAAGKLASAIPAGLPIPGYPGYRQDRHLDRHPNRVGGMASVPLACRDRTEQSLAAGDRNVSEPVALAAAPTPIKLLSPCCEDGRRCQYGRWRRPRCEVGAGRDMGGVGSGIVCE